MIAARTNIASLEGEPGTGKLLFAQNMHAQSSLAGLPFCHADARAWLATDCDVSALSGILYLDRVDLLAPSGQNLLLSFVKMLQNVPPARFLLLTSSHSSLRQLASHNLFLPDLAFRLSAVHFLLPPLRDHREDIAPVTQALIDRICCRYQQPTSVLAPGTLPRLLQHDWPGSVRELASILEAAILASSGIIRPGDLPIQTPSRAASVLPSLTSAPEAPPNASAQDLEDLSLDAAIHRHIVFVLQHHRGNKLRAARQLGISRSTLYRLLAGESAAL
jgi:two-component system response regulator AtoC